MSTLAQVLVFLAAAVLSVPLFKRVGLGAVLGYLIAGVVIGPSGTRLISDVENVMHFAEFGVVFLLFLIGLELQPSRLWSIRKAVFLLGGSQVVITAAAIAAVASALGLSLPAAAVAGVGLSLSSTAFALQLLSEKGQLNSDHGRAAFGILLFQDLAVIPVLALLPVLGEAGPRGGDPGWLLAAKVAGVLAVVVLAGKHVLRPVFGMIASSHSQELFTASALLVVLGTAVAVNAVGLSMALGAFLAGVMLAESEYRHELEADIEPFKGLLLGLFFIAVGMSVKIGLVLERPLQIFGWVIGFTLLKSAVLFCLGRLAKKTTETSLSMAVVISQGGEFAFVLFGLAVGYRIMDQRLADLLVVVVSLSMAVTPLLFLVHERFVRPRLKPHHVRPFDVAPEDDAPVIIAGFGRVGQVVGRILRAKRIPFTAMDASSEHIDFLKRFGSKVFYGDASRLDLLRAARADKAKVFVLAIDDVQASLRTAETVLQHFPQLIVFARARNRQHAYALLNLGIRYVMRETFHSSVEMTEQLLRSLGLSRNESRQTVERFREHDEAMLLSTYKFQKDEKRLVEAANQARQELEEIFEKDARERRSA